MTDHDAVMYDDIHCINPLNTNTIFPTELLDCVKVLVREIVQQAFAAFQQHIATCSIRQSSS